MLDSWKFRDFFQLSNQTIGRKRSGSLNHMAIIGYIKVSGLKRFGFQDVSTSRNFSPEISVF